MPRAARHQAGGARRHVPIAEDDEDGARHRRQVRFPDGRAVPADERRQRPAVVAARHRQAVEEAGLDVFGLIFALERVGQGAGVAGLEDVVAEAEKGDPVEVPGWAIAMRKSTSAPAENPTADSGPGAGRERNTASSTSAYASGSVRGDDAP